MKDVNLSRLRVSVVQTWSLVEERGRATYAATVSGYRGLINSLKDGKVDNYALPWTRKNHYWEYQVGADYQNRGTFDLVAGLVPLRRTGVISLPADRFVHGAAQWEVLWQPYAVSTIVHARLQETANAATNQQFAATLDEALRTGIGDGNSLQDGLPRNLWETQPSHPQVDLSNSRYQPGQPVVLLSGLAALDKTPDGRSMAAVLAGRFEVEDGDAIALRTDGSGLAIKSRTVAVVLTHTLDRTADRLICLQNNLATSMALQEGMLRLQATTTGSAIADWYRSRAGMILTHAYNGTALPHAGAVYKTPLTRLWIQRSPAIVTAINQSAALSDNPPSKPITLESDGGDAEAGNDADHGN